MPRPRRLFNLNKIGITVFISLLALYGIFALSRSLRQSYILDARDRVNVIFYDEKPMLLSFGLTDEVNYIMSPNHGQAVQVPGGYGQYPTASLGRLAEIEHDPALIQRAFSSAISGYVDYYVAPETSKIYKQPSEEDPDPRFERFRLLRLIFAPTVQTNMNIFDKIHIAMTISKKRQSDFIVLNPVSKPDKDQDSVEFYEKGFQKKYKGFFFHQSLREEGLSVKILYDSYSAAVILSRVIEGEGIRVVDLSQLDEAGTERCTIQHALKKPTKTVQFLSKQFNCVVEESEVEGSDIIMSLGSQIEEEWK